MKVKCKKCGTEYGMPDIGIPVEMDDCPICQDLEKTLKHILSESGTQT